MHGHATHYLCLTAHSQNWHSGGDSNIYHENDLHWRARKTEAFPIAKPPSQRPSAASKSEEQVAPGEPRSHPNSQPFHLQMLISITILRIVPYRTVSWIGLVDLLKLDLEDELRVGRDQATADVPNPHRQHPPPSQDQGGNLLASIRVIGADVQPRLLAQLHLDNALIPTCSHPSASVPRKNPRRSGV